jgi:nicotinic acid phosphoribosyltransferase
MCRVRDERYIYRFLLLFQCLIVSNAATFGIGTNFTNDFKTKSSGGKEKSKPLNIVIKIASAGGKPCVKLSDEPSKVGITTFVYGSNRG